MASILTMEPKVEFKAFAQVMKTCLQDFICLFNLLLPLLSIGLECYQSVLLMFR